jgi:hypothetical protein
MNTLASMGARARLGLCSARCGAVHVYRVTSLVPAAIGQHAVAEVIIDYQRTT